MGMKGKPTPRLDVYLSENELSTFEDRRDPM